MRFVERHGKTDLDRAGFPFLTAAIRTPQAELERERIDGQLTCGLTWPPSLLPQFGLFTNCEVSSTADPLGR
jgi:hypothetical protein